MPQNNTQRSLGRIEGKVDGIVEKLDTMDKTMTEHSKKIEYLQKYQATTLGQIKGKESEQKRVAGIIGAASGGFITLVIWVLSKLSDK